MSTSMEPDYTPVAGHESDDPEAMLSNSAGAGDFPSSFQKRRRPPGLSFWERYLPRSYIWRRRLSFVGVLAMFFAAAYLASQEMSKRHQGKGGAGSYLGTTTHRPLQVTTWNIAAINNNPFEYWLTLENDDGSYNQLMESIENFIENPGDLDVPVSKIFNDQMFAQLDQFITGTAGWESVKSYWEGDYRNRKIVSEFLKDPSLGKKRLASMPDRVTNTISTLDGGFQCRPTVVNMYRDNLPDLEVWFINWQNFMFEMEVTIAAKDGGQETTIPYKMLKPISKAKYPDITEEEEKVSLPLQTLCAAIFDCILVHMMNTVSTHDVWQPLKTQIISKLVKEKVPRTLNVLQESYADSDIITLQEVSAALVSNVRSGMLGSNYHVVVPGDMDPARDQNSVILLKKSTFPSGAMKEISSDVMTTLESSLSKGEKSPLEKGDILAIETLDRDNIPFVVASFHGDTDGLATKPVLGALMKTMSSNSRLAKHNLIFGLDANTYEKGIKDKNQEVMDFGSFYANHGLTSCWGDKPQPSNYTTFNARTYLQPQLNKACKSTEKRTCGDVNPKDHILFKKGTWKVAKTWKDNTGEGKYKEDMPFPTLRFPSDHGVLSTVLV